MEEQLIKSVVCICNENGTPEGVGILVSKRHIVTCAHVITNIVGHNFEDRNSDIELNAMVFIYEKPFPIKVRVVEIFPQDNIDFAGLEILTEIFESIPPVKFISNNSLSGDTFRVYGFPDYYNNGVWSYGEIRGKQTDGLIQVESNPNSAYFIKKGFSGSPVWNDDLQGWVGIINKADALRGATMISASTLRQCWTQVIELIATSESQYLSQLVEDLQCFAGIVAYEPPAITIRVKAGKPQPHIKHGIKWSSEFSDVESSARIDDGYLITDTKVGIEEILPVHSRFILLGDLGSGKTTSLQHITIKLAQARLKSGKGTIPLFVDLSDEWIRPQTIDNKNTSYLEGFRNLLEKNWNLETPLDEMLSNGKVIVFLDGLNEMGVDKLEKVNAVRSWIQGQRSPRYVVVACRDTAYTSELDLGLPTAYIGKLKIDAWELIATKLIQHLIDEGQGSQLGVSDFVEAVRNQHELKSILDKPYFIERLVKIYVSSGQVPNTEALILDDFANTVWKRERQQQNKLPEFSIMQVMLGHLAFLLLSRQKVSLDYKEIVKEAVGLLGWLFKREELTNLNLVINAAVHASLLRQEGAYYRFSDEFFRDYFAATYMMVNPSKAIPSPKADSSNLSEVWQQPVKYFHQLLPTEDTKLIELLKRVIPCNPVIAVDSILNSESRLRHNDFVVGQLLNLLKTNYPSSLENSLLLAFKKIGSHSHSQIIQALADKNENFQQKTYLARLAGELRIREATPVLVEIVQREDFYRGKIRSLQEEKTRLENKSDNQKLKENLRVGLGVAALTAFKFGLAILSGNPATLNTAASSFKEVGPMAYHQLNNQNQQPIRELATKIEALNNGPLKLINAAKLALNLLAKPVEKNKEKSAQESRTQFDAEGEIRLNWYEMQNGTERRVGFNSETFTIRIPPGGEPGRVIRVLGKGSVDPHNQQRGNLYLVIVADSSTSDQQIATN
ncbi:peptidase S1 and S6 chymotrypsin/Hap (plasmid) [Leptolyngbya boryana NIES-2135]|jgi:hypothetical protein|uniref:Peptidase S1 and S6 chymotrypsin/Hap n=1 Tax=Leptolyngbya boryana NIES-2135 TaxID=1973484 RepID=A0A1Z4JRA7_LEPBY|nr:MULTISPECIES: serine protease [Leptolyngbya]BAY59295.1 peptidase S1 and S6 chymotrypsin/Hap [Leptolyngbya boryana NIES-2135]MBD2372883.1 trypsin-like peptidase domain-containing protein [Leptolyngbya sp. FACHB-238]MBD2397364.1 trypsin-like peptidase domain-containing protein [Leptolyngbya sp. FACHB-239]MBD2403831.1 trypsin-like peptidase domain-containing protein [Leptolyngbya sp. FACHB-402]ULP33486.1 trypsin-like peptidase domain-containing protein [Leptolyngbya boryana IU 594]